MGVEDDIDKNGWFNIFPKALKNFKDQGLLLMTFGIEGLKANYLFARGGDCWSYAYCEGRQEGKHRAIFERLDKLTLPRPDSFEAFGPSRDYYYTKQFSPLRSEDLSEDRLRRLFAGSLRTLVRWYEENSKAIESIEPVRYRRQKRGSVT